VKKIYTTKVEKDENGESYLILPETLLLEMGWDENTNLEWVDNKDGTFSLKKVEENVTFGRAY
jgi:hypothetical protein